MIAATLAQVVNLVAGVAVAGWLLLGWGWREARAASTGYWAGNLLLTLGVGLTLGRAQAQGALALGLHFWLADMLALSGLAALRAATLLLYGRRPPWVELGCVLGGAACVLALLEPPALRWRGLVFGVAASWICLGLVLDTWRTLRRRPERLAAVVCTVVFGSIALGMGLRAGLLLLGPEWALRAEATSVGTSVPMLWTVLLQLMLMNLTLAGLVLTRVVLRIRQLARDDPLTGCLNRRALDEQLARQRELGGCAVLLLDLDHFKRVNDEFGHSAGDAALLHVVRQLRAGLREVDLIGRWGGEEFMVLLPDTGLEPARQAAERLRASLQQQPLSWLGHPVAITASFGVIACRPGGLNFQELDAALLRAKAEGRNRVVCAH